VGPLVKEMKRRVGKGEQSFDTLRKHSRGGKEKGRKILWTHPNFQGGGKNKNKSNDVTVHKSREERSLPQQKRRVGFENCFVVWLGGLLGGVKATT